jgi:hypothetical protein
LTVSGLLAFVFSLMFFGLIVVFATAGRSRPGVNLREIPAFVKLRRVIGLAVEEGSRIHLTIGRGTITGSESAAAFVSLSMLERMARSTSASDAPPVATAGESSLAILAQDTLRSTYRRVGASEQYDPTEGRLIGLTPFSYAAGTTPIIISEQISTNILIGNFGPEVALITDAGDQSESLTLAGTDNLPAQAILYATANEPLIGEELYASGAYINAGPIHAASLRAQDIIRWFVVALILGGILFKLVGFDDVISNLFAGLM